MARSTPSSRSSSTRSETDSFGPIEVAADRYWGAQTERSRRNFRIGHDRMPMPIVRALGMVKLAAAETNRELGLLDRRRAGAIIRAAREVIDGKLDGSFSAGGLADRLRHANQHEPQRGDRQSRQRTARRQARRQAAGASQRSRQYEPVVERFVSDRDAHRGSDAHHSPTCFRRSTSFTARCATKKRRSQASSRSAGPTPRTRRR